MRRISVFISLFSLTFFFANSFLYAGGLESTTTAARTKTQEFVNAAVKPGTYVFAEKLVKLVGDGIDWYFDRLVIASEKAQIGKISNDVVTGMGKGLSDLKVDYYTNRGLDTVEDLAHKFWLQDFTQQVLQSSDVKIKPYFKGGFEYQSNVFSEPEAPKTRDEALWVWTPGVSINYPFGENNRYRIGAVYEARITEFTKYHQHDDIGQSLGAVGNFKLTDNFFFNVTEEFVKDVARAGTRSAKRVEYTDQIVTPSITYNWRNWSFEGEYKNAIRDFDSAIYRAFSYANNAFTSRFLRDLAPNFRGLVEYTFSHYDYAADATRVGHYYEIKTGVKGQLSKRTSILARIGYQDRDYRNHDTKYDIPAADFRLTHQLTQRTNLDFYGHITGQESQFTNNRAFEEKLVQGSANYLFNEKLRGRVGAWLARRDFDNVSTIGAVQILRRDLLGSIFVGLDYAFRPWLITNLDYRYERSNSNNSNFDYTNNVMSVGMTMPL